MYPIKTIPVFKNYIWGGDKLKTCFNKSFHLDNIAESWELSCHKDGNSIIANGMYSGLSLLELINKQGRDILGSNCSKLNYFPVLIKLIDARDNLSVQVHPDDDYALKIEKELGKTEVWYILDCDPDANILFGFNKNISKAEFASRISDNTLLDVMNKVSVKPGDVYFIPSGTVHAIGKGIVILEVQQNSNSTYRIYDYNRKDANGQSRPLHIDKASDVSILEKLDIDNIKQPAHQQFDGYTKFLIARCNYFTSYSYNINSAATLAVTNTSFHSIICINGSLELLSEHGNLNIIKGDSVFLPACYGRYDLVGNAEVIVTYI